MENKQWQNGQSNMRDTPETNAEEHIILDEVGKDWTFVNADFARKLERERDQWRECAERLASVIRGAGSMRVEAEALDHFERLKEASK